MKRAQLIGIGVAATAGILAFVMLKGMVSQPTVEKRVEVEVNSTEVMVARRDIALGEITNDGLFRWQTWPADAVTPSFITRKTNRREVAKLSGSIARAPILAGEPITKQKLVAAGQGGVLAAILPKGMRAISTEIKEETAAGRLILPNDHVDVILIRRQRGRSGKDEFFSDTLFENVRVLAIGQQLQNKDAKKSSGNVGKTATLELTPRQAEQLALANSMGEISLALRSVSDLNRDGKGPKDGMALNKKRTGSGVRVLRYGVSSRAYGVN